MGKRRKPPGLPKNKPTKKQREEIAARAMLLDATWDDTTNMFVKTTNIVAGGHMTEWTTYYNVMGLELPLKEAKKRIAAAEKRSIMRRNKYMDNSIPHRRSSKPQPRAWLNELTPEIGPEMGARYLKR